MLRAHATAPLALLLTLGGCGDDTSGAIDDSAVPDATALGLTDARPVDAQATECPCPSGSYCADALCVLGCRRAADCAEGELCVAGDCASPEVDAGEPGDAASPTQGVLEVVPARVTLELGVNGAAQQFSAVRRAQDGTPVGLPPERVRWEVEPQTLGVVDAQGLFTSAGRAGSATILARYEGEEARAFIEVRRFDAVLAPGVPADTPARFSGPSAEGCAPALIYPEAATVFPRNMTGLRFQWDGGAGHDAYRLRLSAGDLAVEYFTQEQGVTPEGEGWEALKREAEGGALRITVAGVGGQGEQVCSGGERSVSIDASSLTGAVYYWSTGDVGIMRLSPGDAAAEPLLTPAVAPLINCPACHALSRDGNRIAFTRTTFPPFGELSTSQVDTPTQLNYDPAGVVGYFPSFAPDNQRIVAGAGGQLVILSANDGSRLGGLPLPEMTIGGSPDWSWQGDRIVAAVGEQGLANLVPDTGVNGGSLYQWRLVEEGTWAAPELLVEGGGEHESSYDRPAYNPTGRLIAFQHSAHDTNDQTQANSTSELWIISSDVGDPVRLDRANQHPGLGNSWPKWAPTDRRGRQWLAFSSLRDYGNVLRQPGDARPQIWVAAVDPDAAPGEDPSAPAFWLPGQSVRSGNHIPYWAVYDKGEDGR